MVLSNFCQKVSLSENPIPQRAQPCRHDRNLGYKLVSGFSGLSGLVFGPIFPFFGPFFCPTTPVHLDGKTGRNRKFGNQLVTPLVILFLIINASIIPYWRCLDTYFMERQHQMVTNNPIVVKKERPKNGWTARPFSPENL